MILYNYVSIQNWPSSFIYQFHLLLFLTLTFPHPISIVKDNCVPNGIANIQIRTKRLLDPFRGLCMSRCTSVKHRQYLSAIYIKMQRIALSKILIQTSSIGTFCVNQTQQNIVIPFISPSGLKIHTHTHTHTQFPLLNSQWFPVMRSGHDGSYLLLGPILTTFFISDASRPVFIY